MSQVECRFNSIQILSPEDRLQSRAWQIIFGMDLENVVYFYGSPPCTRSVAALQLFGGFAESRCAASLWRWSLVRFMTSRPSSNTGCHHLFEHQSSHLEVLLPTFVWPLRSDGASWQCSISGGSAGQVGKSWRSDGTFLVCLGLAIGIQFRFRRLAAAQLWSAPGRTCPICFVACRARFLGGGSWFCGAVCALCAANGR